jgi:hypothetical protein
MSRRRLITAGLVTACLAAASGLVALSSVDASAALTGHRRISGTYNTLTSSRFFSQPAVAGQYLLQSNYGNRAAVGGAIPGARRGGAVCAPGAFDLDWDPNAPSFSISNNTANSYFPDGGDPGCGNGQYTGLGTHLTCAQAGAARDGVDPLCRWAGSGDPWVNPKFPARRPDGSSGTVDPQGTTGAPAPWLPPADPDVDPEGPPSQHVTGLSSEFGNETHAAASHPSLVLGCHWGACSPGGGAPFPMRLSGLAAMPVVWDVDTTGARQPGAAWNASLDIWLDTNTRTGQPLPASPQAVNNPGQNDGAEVMIWTNHAGIAGDGLSPTPKGRLIRGGMEVDGVPGRWDMWADRTRSFDNGIRYNVVTFVSLDPVDDFHTGVAEGARGPVVGNEQEGGINVAPFLDNAIAFSDACDGSRCVEPSWWLTSVQAGFEIWNLPSSGSLVARAFSASPFGFTNLANRIGTRVDKKIDFYDPPGTAERFPAHRPVIGNAGGYLPRTGACPGGAGASAWITAPDADGPGDLSVQQPMMEWPAGSGSYVGTSPVNLTDGGRRMAGRGSLTFTVSCPNGTVWSTGGAVQVSGAADLMWLNRDSGQLGEWLVAPDGGITSNPILTMTCVPDCQRSWRVVGSGDLNADGQSDLLWLNASAGELSEWVLTGTNDARIGPTLDRTCDDCGAGNRVVGIADLNDDGFNDVLWFNPTTGLLAQWYLDRDGNVRVATDVSWACASPCSDAWRPVAVADMNDDGHVDVVWDNRSADTVDVWLLDGRGRVLGDLPIDRTCQCEATLVGAGDRDGDGHADLYWYDPVTGVVDQWLLDGAGHVTGTARLTWVCDRPSTCSTVWTLVGANEFGPA